MEIILLILGAGILFVFLGIMGWGLKGLGVIFDFLWEGCATSFGCMFWVGLILLLLIAMAL